MEKMVKDFGSRTRSPAHPNSSPKKRLEDQSITEDAAGDSTTEEAILVMREVDPGEEETGKKMWLSQRFTSPE